MMLGRLICCRLCCRLPCWFFDVFTGDGAATVSDAMESDKPGDTSDGVTTVSDVMESDEPGGSDDVVGTGTVTTVTVPDDEAVVNDWNKRNLPNWDSHHVPTRPATIYSANRICGSAVLNWVKTEVEALLKSIGSDNMELTTGKEQWDKFQDGLEQMVAATTTDTTAAWTKVFTDLIRNIRPDDTFLHNQTKEYERHTMELVSYALVVYYFGVLYMEWQDGRRIAESMWWDEQDLSSATLALRVPCVIRRQFLQAFATCTLDDSIPAVTTDFFLVTGATVERFRTFHSILYLMAHEEFDRFTNEPSKSPLKADFTIYGSSLKLHPFAAAVSLKMAGCSVAVWPEDKTLTEKDVTKATKVNVTATLDLELSYPPVAQVVAHIIDWKKVREQFNRLVKVKRAMRE